MVRKSARWPTIAIELSSRLRGFGRIGALSAMMMLASCGSGDAQGGPGGKGGPVQVGYVVVQASSVPVEQSLPGRVAAFQISEVRPAGDPASSAAACSAKARSSAKARRSIRSIPASIRRRSTRPSPMCKAPGPAPKPPVRVLTATSRWPKWRRCRSRTIPTPWPRPARRTPPSPRTTRAARGRRRSTFAIPACPAPISGRIGLSALPRARWSRPTSRTR